MKKILLLVVLFGVTNRLSADLGEGEYLCVSE